MTHSEERIWLINKLKEENPSYRKIAVPADEQGQKDVLRILMNVRMPKPLGKQYIDIQDSYLRKEAILKGIVDEKTLEPCRTDARLFIWQGDITRLRVDAIVNAANSALLGCFQPLHSCIDNFIHSAAGLQLREACAEIMRKQGHDEPTGQAKITPGYNLPARYVLHTVGPIVDYGVLTDEHRKLLRSSYRSCLEEAERNKLESVAFCCISTGVFMFPAEEAAKIAISSVKEYLDEQESGYKERTGSDDEQDAYRGVQRVIFNVFKDRDRLLYEDILN